MWYRFVGRNKNAEDKDDQNKDVANQASYVLGYGLDFQSG